MIGKQTFEKLNALTIAQRMEQKPLSSISFADTDGYKISHWLQDPEGMTDSQGYAAARTDKETIVFSAQYILQQIKVPTLEEVEVIKYIFDNFYAGEGIFNYEGWKAVAELGYIPLSVSAVPEGTLLDGGCAYMFIKPTLPDFQWMRGWFENQLLRTYYAATVVTNSYKVKQILAKWLRKNGTIESLPFKLVDFGSRGASSKETAGIGSCANLLNFVASDTFVGATYAFDFYGAKFDGLIGTIGASEHGTTTVYGRTGEKSFYEKMIKVFGKEGAAFANVIDSYDQKQALNYILSLVPTLKASGATMIIRLDSGDAVDNPVMMTQYALELFGYEVNDKGYKVLPNYIRILQGDGVTPENIDEILRQLDELKISSDNISFGMGGKLLQDVNRDTYGYALKTCYAKINGEDVDVFKDPITDPSKASLRGEITTVKRDGKYVTVRVGEVQDTDEQVVREIWRNSEFIVLDDFDTIKSRIPNV